MAEPPLHTIGDDPDPRFTLANERTFLAWNRTALALVGGGLAAGELLNFHSRGLRLAVALPPMILGALLALTSYRRWEGNERALRLGEPLPASGPTRLLAFGLALLALVITVLVVVDVLT